MDTKVWKELGNYIHLINCMFPIMNFYSFHDCLISDVTLLLIDLARVHFLQFAVCLLCYNSLRKLAHAIYRFFLRCKN